MGQPGTVMIAKRRQENLRLVFEAAKGLAVYDPVPVPLESGANGMGLFRTETPLAFGAQAGPGRQILLFHFFNLLSDVHGLCSFSLPASPS
jgi:hypothetical protein